MKNINYLSSWIKRFLMEYLINVRNLSKNTQKSYRDTFKLCLLFIEKKLSKSIEQLTIEDITPEIIKEFLISVEITRNCSLTTRNQRLAAIHAFSKFIGLHNPEYIEWCRQIHLIPFKKTKRT